MAKDIQKLWGAVPTAVEIKAEGGAPKLTVETINNHVYFYAGVDSDRCLAMIRAVRDLDAMLRAERLTRSIPEDVTPTPIWLHINSFGGDLFTGLAMSDQLKQVKTPVYSVVEGCCASAATLIAMSCTKRYILPRSFMLIHQLQNVMWGKYEDFKDEMVLMDMMMQQITAFYVTNSKMTEKKIKEALKRDTWYNADQCLENGLVDRIGNG
jgi:ATP-dependent protease ClpP protease subunit